MDITLAMQPFCWPVINKNKPDWYHKFWYFQLDWSFFSLLVETPTEQLLASYLSLMITINMIYFFCGWSYHLLTLFNDDMTTSIYRYWSFCFTSHFNFSSFPAGKADHWKVIFYQSRYTEYNKVGAYIISVMYFQPTMVNKEM